MQLIINNFSTTGTATWARATRDKFQGRGVHFVDSPVSGGPARAKLGDLTVMASGDDASLEKAKPILNAMGRDVYIIQGGAGMGSTVKVQKCAPCCLFAVLRHFSTQAFYRWSTNSWPACTLSVRLRR